MDKDPGRHSAESVQLARMAPADAVLPDLDDTSGRSLLTDLLWTWRNVLPPRRKKQAALVFGLMLLGGFAELMTLGAVVPLLALLAGSGSSPSDNRIDQLLLRFGIDQSDYSLTSVALAFCGVAIGAGCIRIVLAWAGQRYVYGIRSDVGVALYNRMLHQPYTFHVGINSSRIMSNLENVSSISTGMMMPLLQASVALVIGVFVLAGLLVLNAAASFVAILGFGLIYGGLTLTGGRRLRRNARVIATMAHQRLQTINEGFGGIGDVLLDNTQPIYVRKFAKIDRRLSDAQGANALMAVAPRFIAEAAGIILIVMLALVLSGQPGGASASLPVLGALALGAQRLLPLMQQSYFGWASLLGNRSRFMDLVTLLRHPVTITASTETLPPLRRGVELIDVGFRYSSDRHFTLRNVSLEIPKGSRVGFVGKTGSGKTTLLNLVMGLLDPASGEILIDGRPLTAANKQSWQKQVAHVPQSIFLTDGPIAENIALGVPAKDIDHDRLRDVCRQADLAQFIETLPGGYSTPVGERGVRLSGGQIQRIGLARALYKDATVLVLDEATSALDDTTEANIIDAVQRLGPKYTVLMIAHRTTTLRECDIIYRLDSGRLIESGPAEVVLGSALRGPLNIVSSGAAASSPKSRFS